MRPTLPGVLPDEGAGVHRRGLFLSFPYVRLPMLLAAGRKMESIKEEPLPSLGPFGPLDRPWTPRLVSRVRRTIRRAFEAGRQRHRAGRRVSLRPSGRERHPATDGPPGARAAPPCARPAQGRRQRFLRDLGRLTLSDPFTPRVGAPTPTPGVTLAKGLRPGTASLPPRHGFPHQEAPQAHAQEEAQEDAEGDPLAAPGGEVAPQPPRPGAGCTGDRPDRDQPAPPTSHLDRRAPRPARAPRPSPRRTRSTPLPARRGGRPGELAPARSRHAARAGATDEGGHREVVLAGRRPAHGARPRRARPRPDRRPPCRRRRAGPAARRPGARRPGGPRRSPRPRTRARPPTQAERHVGAEARPPPRGRAQPAQRSTAAASDEPPPRPPPTGMRFSSRDVRPATDRRQGPATRFVGAGRRAARSPRRPSTSRPSPGGSMLELVGQVDRHHLGVELVEAVGPDARPRAATRVSLAGASRRAGRPVTGRTRASSPQATTSSSSARAVGRHAGRLEGRRARPAPARLRRSILRRCAKPARTTASKRR